MRLWSIGLAAAAAACGASPAAKSPAAPRPVVPVKVQKKVRVVEPEPYERDERAGPTDDGAPGEDPGFAWAAVNAVASGGLDEYALGDELHEHEDAFRSCFVADGVEYSELSLRVTWSSRASARIVVTEAYPDEPSTALADCLRDVLENVSLMSARIGAEPSFPASADISLERSHGSEGGVAAPPPP